jgi:hypothetical protein
MVELCEAEQYEQGQRSAGDYHKWTVWGLSCLFTGVYIRLGHGLCVETRGSCWNILSLAANRNNLSEVARTIYS